jgi:hypothetical protein
MIFYIYRYIHTYIHRDRYRTPSVAEIDWGLAPSCKEPIFGKPPQRGYWSWLVQAEGLAQDDMPNIEQLNTHKSWVVI